MKITIRQSGTIAILDLVGNIDINASILIETVGKTLHNGIFDIVLNFGDINLIDYVGISLIAVAYKNIINKGGRVSIYGVPAHVMKLFSVVGLDRVFSFHTSQKHAIDDLRKQALEPASSQDRLRRRFKRIPLRISLEYRPRNTQTPFLSGEVINLSAEGVFMTAGTVFPVGTVLEGKLSLLPNPGVLDVYFKVAWLSDADIQSLYYPGMGLEFHSLSPQDQELIISFVERHLTHFS